MQTNKSKKIKKGSSGQDKDKQKGDSRFKAMEYDPKFRAPSKNVGKVKIDRRFSKMMSQPEFKISGTVDKYGRAADPEADQREHLQDYYYHEESGEAVDNQAKQENALTKWMHEYNEVSSDDIQEEAYDEMLEKEGEGIWSDDDEKVVKNEHVQATRRLALCSYDWMNINAKDLILLFSSFKPSSGTIRSVTVYYSMFGKERLQSEELNGPQGIWNPEEKNVEEQQKKTKGWKSVLNKNVNKESEAFDQRKLRQYEKERLKYCYAVIHCDSKKTADQIYKQCDGNQFQNSNLLFDLRFIPDDTQFDEGLLKEKSSEIPVCGEVKNFVSKAVGHSNVSLTWEDPELNLAAGLKKKNWNAMSEEQMDKIDWGVYLNEANEEAEENYNKVMRVGKAPEEEEIDVSDWRKECNKKMRKRGSDDDIQISFPTGFDCKPAQDHESLKKQIKSRRERREGIKEERKNRQKLQFMVDKEDGKEFKFDAEDPRFKAVFNNPLYSINPVDPKFDHRKVGKVFEEVVKQNKKKEQN